MAKSQVFISHITDEAEIAADFKLLIEQHFLGLIDVFVSSDGSSIKMGQRWLEDISKALEQCAVEIVICSPKSVTRPWINFEAGAGWVRGIPVIPLCHSGMEPSSLPIPLNLLQAAKATEVNALRLVFSVLALALGAKTPDVDFTAFIQKVQDFERRYTFWDRCNEAFTAINDLDDSIISRLKDGHLGTISLTEIQISILTPHINFLREENILNFQRTGIVDMDHLGTSFEFNLTQLSQFTRTASDTNFKF